MMAMRSTLALLASVAIGGCAASGSSDRFPPPDHATWGDWQDEAVTDSDPTALRQGAVRRDTFRGPGGNYEVVYDDRGRAVVPQQPIAQTIAPRALRPPTVGPRTIRIDGARLDNALRIIAETGRFNLLVEGDLTRPVSARLVAVEPYEALVVLAGAHGALVNYDGSIVIVSAAAAGASGR
jgi:hypothetical protein